MSTGRTVIVTGGNAPYFLMGCMMEQSLSARGVDLPFYFLDFGLTEQQRRFLAARGTLLEIPPQVAAVSNPFLNKTAIGEYLHNTEWSEVVWIDSDMVAIGPVAERLSALLIGMATAGSDVAVCVDSQQTIKAATQFDFDWQPFLDLVRQDGIDPNSVYYNTGFFVIRSRAFLDDWWKLARDTRNHVIIDQNIFNIMARRRGEVTVLDAREWNFHGSLLGTPLQQDSTLLLHPTGLGTKYHTEANFNLTANNSATTNYLKLFRDDVLRRHQHEALAGFLDSAMDELREAGLISNSDSVASQQLDALQSLVQWGRTVTRNEPCPCGSGKRFKHCHGKSE